jgi:hypothetical protein
MHYADRVQETTTTAGTGTVSLGGAVSGYRAFSSVFADQTFVSYCLVDGVAWEVGIGLLTTGTPWTLTRLVVNASTNANAAISLSGGSTTVFNTAPAVEADHRTVKTTVDATDFIVVPYNRQLNMTRALTVLGSLFLLGDVAVL